MTDFELQRQKMLNGAGFIAALDQSGGSTPKALKLYGVNEDAWSNDSEMFDLVHEMRSRIMTSPAFDGGRILAAILFEDTMERSVEGRPTADYLWGVKQIVPILKVDQGLADEEDGVQLMKPMPGLADLLKRATAKRIFGTKMRSVIKHADLVGIRRAVTQQFEFGAQIGGAGLVPIIEPEVDIHCKDKGEAEALLKNELLAHLDKVPEGLQVMLKLTLPEQNNLYRELIVHPRVLKVAALSGGYFREDANRRLKEQQGMVASFSRALTEGLSVEMSVDAFNAKLSDSIQSIFDASNT